MNVIIQDLAPNAANAEEEKMDREDREFLDRRFNAIDEKFAGIDEKFEETKRHFGVLAEGLRNEIRQVAEGHQIILDGQARIMDRIEQVERELGAMIKFSYAELDSRVRALEETVLSLQARMERLEARQS